MRRFGTLAVIVAATLVLGGVAGFVSEGDDERSGRWRARPFASSTTETTRAPDTTLPPPTPSELDGAVAEISAFVEEARGLSFREPVRVELAGEGDFQARLLEDFDEDREKIKKAEAVLQALGLIDHGVDLVAQVEKLLGAGVVGFYDPETNELVVRGAGLTPYVRQTIAHELTHALDDQHFELHRPEVDEADDERGFGFSGLVEGNAVRVEDEYLASLPREEQREARDEALEFGGGFDLGSVPLVLIESVLAPYRLGPSLVESLLRTGGQPRLDAAFAAPPTTSEQLLRPDKYLGNEEAISVPPPRSDGELFDQGAVGAFVLQLLLEQVLGRDEVERAVDGWGGDWYVAWKEGARTCLRAAFIGDGPADTAEIGGALEAWAEGVANGAHVETPSGLPPTLTSCS